MAENETKILSSMDKAKMQAIIADVKFVNETEADSYRCNKCSSIAIYHYIASCSHVLCGKCHGQYCNKHCPVIKCKNTLIDKISQNLEFEFGMYNLKVYCTFRGNGCENVIELSNVMVHQSTCKFSTQNLLPRLWVASPLQKLEEDMFTMNKTIKDILDTNDQFKNNIAGINDKISVKMGASSIEFNKKELSLELQEKLVRNIDKKIEELEQKFSSSMKWNTETEKQKLNAQIVMECDVIKLKLSKISQEQLANEQKKLRDQMEKKIDDLKNNSLLIQKDFQIDKEKLYKLSNKATEDREKLCKEIEQFKLTINNMGQQINSLQKQLQEKPDIDLSQIQLQEMYADFSKSYEFSWTIDNFSKIKRDSAHQVTSDFVSNDCKCKISTKFDLVFGLYHVFTTCVLYEIESNAPQHLHKTTVYILDQSNRRNLKHISRIDEPVFYNSRICNENYVDISTSELTKNHIKNDSVIVKIIIEPFFCNYKFSTCSQNGTLIWKLDNYAIRKQDDIDGGTSGIYSDYFLSSKEGYRMKLKFTFDSLCIVIHLMFVLGEFDHSLEKKFRHKTTFTIIDQSDKPKKTHLIKTVENDRPYLDWVEFTSTEFEKSTYLKNDCMIVKVSV